jgi:hypothetical protein
MMGFKTFYSNIQRFSFLNLYSWLTKSEAIFQTPTRFKTHILLKFFLCGGTKDYANVDSSQNANKW